MRKALYFLGILNDSDVDWLMAAGSPREVPPGTRLIEEGHPINSVYLVIDGAFTAHTGDRDTGRLMSGELMGEMSFVDRALPARTIEALEPSFVLEIPRRRLDARLADDPGFAARFYRALAMSLAARLRNASGELAGGAEPEMDFEALVAGARIDWVQKRLRSS
jgi:CRP-like cAMP-binding protein